MTLKAIHLDRDYWNGESYIRFDSKGLYTPQSEAEKECLLKCMGVEELEMAPPPSKRKAK